MRRQSDVTGTILCDRQICTRRGMCGHDTMRASYERLLAYCHERNVGDSHWGPDGPEKRKCRSLGQLRVLRKEKRSTRAIVVVVVVVLVVVVVRGVEYQW